jgi:hypothetical protein
VFEAIVFTIRDCDFIPRCALEVADSSEVRIDKIVRIISDCCLGIHDISRTELDEETELPRFNMPLELGLYLGAKKYGNARQKLKQCLILDREPYRYQKYCSDISGQDIEAHGSEPHRAVVIIRDWLRERSKPPVIPGGLRLVRRYQRFRADLPAICDRLGADEDHIKFGDFLNMIEEWLLANDWGSID